MPTRTSRAAGSEGIAHTIGFVNGSRILLVEDDDGIGAELTQALAGCGHLPSLARTGAEVVDGSDADAA